jgi:hypothetical protein
MREMLTGEKLEWKVEPGTLRAKKLDRRETSDRKAFVF